MPRRVPIFYGWWVLLACALIQLFFSATFLSGLSALVNPLIDEFGWSYAMVSLAFTFRGFETGFFAPIIGFFVDRFRPRRLLFIGCLMGALGLFLLSRVQSLTGFLISVVVLGMALSMNASTVVMTAAAYWFKKNTGLAMGILSVGAGAGGLFMPLVITLIDHVGWRTAMIIFAVVALVIITPLSIIVKDPPDYEKASASRDKPQPEPAGDALSVREVLRTKAFWLLALAVLFTGLSNTAVLAHQIPYLVSVGLDRNTAGYMVLILAIANIIGRLGFGWLGDLIPIKITYLIAALILVSGLAIFAYAETVTQTVPAVILLGIGTGSVVTLRSVVQLGMFGKKTFAIVQGMLIAGITIGSMAAPLLTGLAFDTFQTYRPAWLALAVITFVAIPLILSLPKPKSEIIIKRSVSL
jgi:MFS family permease